VVGSDAAVEHPDDDAVAISQGTEERLTSDGAERGPSPEACTKQIQVLVH
jgi:hypothetical protein